MTLENWIKEKIFPADFEDTFMRFKKLGAAKDGTFAINYFFDDFADDKIKAHCNGDEILAAYAVNGAGNCCWFGVDIDAHGTEQSRTYNLDMVFKMAAECPFDYTIEQSNEKGGYHFWLFPPVTKAEDAIALLDNLFEYKRHDKRPCYTLRAKELPLHGANVLRLPGKHHNHGTWSKFYIDNKFVDVREL